MKGAVGSGNPAREGGLSAPLLGLMAQFTPRGYFCQNESGISVHCGRILRCDPVKHRCNVMDLRTVRKGGAVNHEDRNSQSSRGDKFGLGPSSAGILGDDQGDVMRLHQGCVRVCVKRAAVDDDVMIGQGGRGLWRIDEAQKVAVLRMVPEGCQMHPSQGQHDILAWSVQRSHRRRDVRHTRPLVAFAGGPWRPRQGQKGRACMFSGLNSIGTDRCGKGVGCIDQMGDLVVAQIGCKPLRAAKPAYAHGHRLGFGAFHAPGIAECGGQPCGGKRCHKARGLDRAAENEDIWHG